MTEKATPGSAEEIVERVMAYDRLARMAQAGEELVEALGNYATPDNWNDKPRRQQCWAGVVVAWRAYEEASRE